MRVPRMSVAVAAALTLFTGPAAAALPISGGGGTTHPPLRSDDPFAGQHPNVVPAAQPRLPAQSTVTLITGERVRLDVDPSGLQNVTALPTVSADGTPTAPATLARFTWNGDAYAVPGEAVPYLSTMDLRLFDVSYLVRAKLDDAHTTSLPVTIRTAADSTATVPGVSGVLPAGTSTTTSMAKAQTAQFGAQVGDQWRASRYGDSTLPVGTLPDLTRISLAPPPDAPALPAAPTSAGTADQTSPKNTAGGGLHYHTLTMKLVDLEGGTGVGLGVLQNVDDARLGFFFVDYPGMPGPLTFSVPDGTYSTEMSVFTPQPTNPAVDAALVVNPQFDVTRDRTITLDARTAKPYQVSLDRPANVAYTVDIMTFDRVAAGGGGYKIDGFGFLGIFSILAMRLVSFNGTPQLFATPTQPVSKGALNFAAFTQWLPDAVNPSPDPRYRFLFPHAGSIPPSLDFSVRAADLAEIHNAVYQGPGDTSQPQLYVRALLPWTLDQMGVGDLVPPGNRVDYLYSSAPDITLWSHQFTNDGVRRTDPWLALHPGQRVSLTWGKAPSAVPSAAMRKFGTVPIGLTGPLPPTMPSTSTTCPACRQDDNAVLFLAGFGDSDPQHWSNPATEGLLDSHLAFYRNGALAVTSDTQTFNSLVPDGLPLPLLAQPATYRLEWSGSPGADPAAQISTAWTFRSGRDDGAASPPDPEKCAPDPSRTCSFLPLLFLHYDLDLDFQSQARAGTTFPITFTVSGQQGAPTPTGVAATVSVSYDGGATWSAEQPAQAGADGTFHATVTHPELAATDGFVALRVRAHDGAGNAVDQTILHAYGLTG